jgi:putative acetyltransferase
MGVHDGWTGRGLGTRLMREAVDYADRWLGLRRLELTVFTDNAPALALYRRFGFVVEGTHRGFALRDGVLADAHCMARLTEPAALAG